MLHACHVNVLSGVPFLRKAELEKGQPITNSAGENAQVFMEPENKLNWCGNECLISETFSFHGKRMSMLLNIRSTYSWCS